MDWGKIWRTLFCGWEADFDFVALARDLAQVTDPAVTADDAETTAWVCRQIQEAY
jgi:hypothetical protein